MAILVRSARVEDAPGLAQVHVQSWRETYTSLLPADFLERMTNEAMRQRREQSWRMTLEQARESVFIAEQGEQIVAFASVGPARDHPGYGAELMTLYSLKRVQGQGLGRELLRRSAQASFESGAHNLALWVLDRNPARQWYAGQGAHEDGEKTDGDLREVRMAWADLRALL